MGKLRLFIAEKKILIIVLSLIVILVLVYFVGFSKTRDYGQTYSIDEVYEMVILVTKI